MRAWHWLLAGLIGCPAAWADEDLARGEALVKAKCVACHNHDRLVKLALRFRVKLQVHPYFARNWTGFGVKRTPTYGAVLVFERGPNSGHVGFCVGESLDGKAFLVLGGNQGDTVSVVPIAKSRMLACRWPATFPLRPINLPRMSVTQALSTNEA